MDRDETYSFGEWLKGRRTQMRLTQRELASRTHCSVAMLKKIEADERRPSPELAALLAAALHLPEQDHARFVAAARGEQAVDGLWSIEREPSTTPWIQHAPLPHSGTPFIGRRDELQAIEERLSNPDCRLLTLVGTGGIGKTRLALAAAQSQQGGFNDGVTFVALASVTDAALIPDAVARALRLTLTGNPAEQVLIYLRRRQLLLILDNCEQLAGDLQWFSDLFAAAPHIKILATSRARLHLAEEWVYPVPALAEADALFVQTAQRVTPDFQSEREQSAVQRICQLVEKLPLAIELAASWTPVMTCSEIGEHIERDISILEAEVQNVPDRHRSIHAVFDHSWELLSSDEQTALMDLSVFAGGWRAEEAQRVAGANLRMLRRLVDKSLVRVGTAGRYELHELIRQFALRKLAQSNREHAARQRHFAAYLVLAARLDSEQFSPQGMEAVVRFDQEQANLRAALAWSLDNHSTDAALQLLSHLWFYWSRRGAYHEGTLWGMRAIEQAADLASTPLCIALSIVASLLFVQGHYAQAEPFAQRALAMARRLEDAEALIWALGTYTFASVNIEQALTHLDEGIALVKETGYAQHALPMLHLGAATWYHSAGRIAEASAAYRESITLFRQLGVLDFIADPLGRLGQLALQTGDLQEAYDLTVESIRGARTTGYEVVFSAWGSARLGLIQLYLGQVEAAQRSVEEALAYFEDERDLRVKQEALAILSEVLLVRDDVQAAAKQLQASLTICETLYRQLQATHKLEGTLDALPVDLIALCARAALVAAAQGRDARSVTLCSMIASLRTQSGQMLLPPLQAKLEKAIDTIRGRLSDTDFDKAWQAGQSKSLAEAFAFLLN
jgi:predicted ATPase/transcriptional regulator with XRE-family HTH domain